MTLTNRNRLKVSGFCWNDRPSWDYIGKPRFVGFKPVAPQKFSILLIGKTAQIWSIADQAWAVEQGFFIQREIERERAVIMGVDKFDRVGPFSYWRPYEAMREIERRAFRREPRYERLLDFIRQQDQYGYTGAWHESVQVYTDHLAWYKHFKAMQKHKGRPTKRIIAMREQAAKARDHKDAKRARTLILRPTVTSWRDLT